MLMRISNDNVGEIDSLLQTIPKGVVDQTKTTTRKAIDTGIYRSQFVRAVKKQREYILNKIMI